MQHAGAPCTPLVKKGDHVYRGQKIGDSSAFSARRFMKASRHRLGDQQVMLPRAGLRRHRHRLRRIHGIPPDLTPPIVSNTAEFTAAIRESGLVGLGGAGFPAHVKLNIPPNKKKSTIIIINAASREPYVTSDHHEAIESPAAVHPEGIYALKSILNINRVIIAVEDKPDVIEALKKIADNTDHDPNNEVRILPLKSKYPQGAPKSAD